MNQSRIGIKPKIAVGIATSGRREIVRLTIDLLSKQTRLPDILILCPATLDDLDIASAESQPFATVIKIGKRGLTAQRNTILSVVVGYDIIVFFDDDFFPRNDYLENVELLFRDHKDVVAITGRPIMDGANGPGIEAETALRLVEEDALIVSTEPMSATYGTYGCNMAFRVAPIGQLELTFDEKLPLYGWQEDIDFSRQLSVVGRIIDAKSLRGVHLGAKGGRTSGIRFGYSQVANPIYLVRKGTISARFAWPLMLKNLAANLWRSLSPEPWIDRRGRLKGNWLAARDFVSGRLCPNRILRL